MPTSPDQDHPYVENSAIAEITGPTVIAKILGHIAAREAGEGTARSPDLASAALH